MAVRGVMKVRAGWAWVGLVVAAISAPVRAEEGRDRAATWLAPDAALYVEVTRPGALIDRLTDEHFVEGLKALPPVRKALDGDGYRQATAVADHLANRLGTTRMKALRDLTGGGLAIAVAGEPGEKPRIVITATPKDPALLRKFVDAALDMIRQDAKSKGNPSPIESKEYRGVKGYKLGDGALAIVKDTLILANTPEAMKAVIDRDKDAPKPVDETWQARRAEAGTDAVAWGLARLDRLRALDPKKFSVPEKLDGGPTFLLGGWIEAIRKAPWLAARLTWTDRKLGADVTLPAPPDGFAEALKGFIPPKGAGAPSPVRPPRTILSVGLWRDLAAIWEARADLFSPEAVQNLAQLDGVAGQFFGGRDFGTGVLGALGKDWRLVIARQDGSAIDPAPEVTYPAFALVADVKPADDEFRQRLKVAFQSFIGLVNIGAAQQKAPPLELGTETFEGVSIATAKYANPKPDPADDGKKKEPANKRYNFSPSAALVGDSFVLSSTAGLARDLVHELKAPPAPSRPETLVIEADGDELARLIGANRDRLVMQNMLEKGHDKEQAEAEVNTLAQLVRTLGRGRLTALDNTGTVRINLNFDLK